MTEKYEKESSKKQNLTLSLMIFLILQFAGVIWWAAGIQAQVKHNTSALGVGKRYTYEMSVEDRESHKGEHIKLEKSIERVEYRTNNTIKEIKDAVLRLEIKLDKILLTK